MVDGPAVLMVAVLALIVALAMVARLRDTRVTAPRSTVPPPPAAGRARHDAAVREARQRLDERVLLTHQTSPGVVPQQRPVRG